MNWSLSILILLSAFSAPLVASERTFRIGLLFDRKDPTQLSRKIVDGIRQGAKELRDLHWELQEIDAGSTAETMREGALAAIRGDFDVVIGGVDSSKTLIAAKEFEKAGKVLVTPYATSPQITRRKGFVFRTCFDDLQQGQKLAQFAHRDLRAQRAVIIMDAGQLYSHTLTKAFREAFQTKGGKVVAVYKVFDGDKSYLDIINKIRKVSPDVVFLPLYESVAVRLITESLEQKFYDLTFLGGDGFGETIMFDQLIFKKQIAIRTYWATHHSRDWLMTSGQLAEMSSAAALDAPMAIGRDTMHWVGRNLARIKGDVTQDKVRDQLASPQTYQGLTGEMKFTNGARTPKKSLFIMKVDRGRDRFVKRL